MNGQPPDRVTGRPPRQRDRPGRAAAVDHRSQHVCHSRPDLGEITTAVPLLPPIDQWGTLPLPLQRLAPHSLSRRVRDLLAGDLGAHRDLPVDPDAEPVVTAPEKPPVVTQATGRTYDAVDASSGLGPPPP